MARRRFLRGVRLTLVALACACRGSPTAPSAGDPSIVVHGLTRTYTAYTPASFVPHVGALVIALHGAGDNGLSFERTSGLSATADQGGFVVAYPDGLFNPRVGASDWEH